MADPQELIRNGYLFTESELINQILDHLYEPDENGQVTRIPTTEEFENIFAMLLDEAMEGAHVEHQVEHIEIKGLITNLVLFDASVDEIFGLHQDLPPTYRPARLLELIGYPPEELAQILVDVGMLLEDPMPRYAHIFHWASERLYPYFVEKLGRDFVLGSRTIVEGNTYLHSYLSSGEYRVLHPAFVERLLADGFLLSEKNNEDYTPLHLILLNAYHPFAQLTHSLRTASPHSHAVKRYNAFYRTLVILFRHPSADLDLPDYSGVSVRERLYSNDPRKSLPFLNEAREAYEITQGRPTAIEWAKKQKLTQALPIPTNVGKTVESFLGSNFSRAQETIRQQQQRNARTHKAAVLRELQERVPRRNHGGARSKRTRRIRRAVPKQGGSKSVNRHRRRRTRKN